MDKQDLINLKNELLSTKKKPEVQKQDLNEYMSCSIASKGILVSLDKTKIADAKTVIYRDFASGIGQKKFEDFLGYKIEEGLEATTGILDANESLSVVSISSPIIGEHPDAFKSEGFTIKVVSDEQLDKMFPSLTKEQKENYRYGASISRENVLSRFGNKEKGSMGVGME